MRCGGLIWYSRNTTLSIPPRADQSNTGLASKSLTKKRPGVKENKDRSTVSRSLAFNFQCCDDRVDVHDFNSNPYKEIVKINVANVVERALNTVWQTSLKS